MDKDQEQYFFFIYYMRRNIPQSKLFYSLYYLVSYIPIIIMTHNINGNNDSMISIGDVFLSITCFGKGFPNNYWLFISLSIIIFLIMMFLLIGYIIIYKRIKKYILLQKTIDPCLNNKTSAIPTDITIPIQYWTYFFLFIRLFSEHMIEYCSFGIFYAFIKKQEIFEVQYTDGFLKYIICGLDIISIVLLILVITLYYSFTNTPFISLKKGNLNYIYNTKVNTLLIASSLQGVYTIINAYMNTSIFRMIMLTIILLLVLLNIIQLVQYYNYYQNSYSLRLQLLLMYWTVITAVIQFGLYFFEQKNLDKSDSICLFIIEIINAYIMTKVTVYYNGYKYIDMFMKNIFSAKKPTSVGEIISYTILLERHIKKEKSLNDLIQIVYFHKDQCILPDCTCHMISLSDWIIMPKKYDKEKETDNYITPVNKKIKKQTVVKGKEKITAMMQNKASENNNKLRMKAYELFISLGEHEISKTIHSIYKKNTKAFKVEMLMLAHIDYVLGIKRSSPLAFYLTIQYLMQKTIELSFLTKYYLYEFKHFIYEEFTVKKYYERTMNLDGKYHEDLIIERIKHANRLYSFIKFIHLIKNLMKSICRNIEKMMDYRKSFATKSLNLNVYYSKCERFSDICDQLSKDTHKLKSLISNVNEPLEHYELCYLITNYYLMTQKTIPKDIRSKMFYIPSFSYFNQHQDLLNSYEKYSICNPLIFSINENDEFLIKYMARRLLTLLKYQSEEIIGSNINILLPDEIGTTHTMILKQFCLLSSTVYRRKTFILDRNKYLIPITIHGFPIPTIETNYNIIINVELNSNARTRENKYYLLLNTQYNFISANQCFIEDFFFTLQMFNSLGLDFCSFFGIESHKLERELMIKMQSKKYRYNLDEENKKTTIFSSNKEKKLLSNRLKINKIIKNSTEIITLERNITKGIMITTLPKIIKMIEDLGFDMVWFHRVNCLKERLKLPNSSNCFNIQFKYKCLGNIRFSIVFISETIEPVKYSSSFFLIKESFNNLSLFTGNMKDLGKENIAGFNSSYNINGSKVTQRSIGIDGDSFTIASLSKFGQKINQSSFNLMDNPKDISQGTNLSLLKQSDTGLFSKKYKHNQKISPEHLSIIDQASIKKYTIYNGILMSENASYWLKITYRYICFIMVVLSLFGFLVNEEILSLSKKISDINIYAVLLKSDIYFIALSIFVCCEYASVNDQEGLLDQRWRLEFRGDEVIKHYSILLQSLNQLVSNSQINPIFDILSSNHDYLVILPNFKTNTKKSNICEEIFRLHFDLMILKDESMFQKCRLKEIFFYENYKNLDNKTPPPSIEEQNVYYVMNNVLTTFREILEKLTLLTNKILTEYHMQCKDIIVAYNSILLVSALCLTINIFLLLWNRRVDIQLRFNNLYSRNPNDNLFEEKIAKFKCLIDNFTLEQCEIFEDKKNNNSKKTTTIVSTIDKLDKKFMHKSSSLIPLSSKSKNNIKIKQTDINNEHNNNNFKKVIEIDPVYLTPLIVKTSMIIVAFLSVLFCGINICAIFIYSIIYDELLFANMISLNFLDRVPKLCELLLYSRISVLANNINYLIMPTDQYNLNSYSNYYNITFDISENTIFQILDESQFAYMYYQSLQINRNIERFVSIQSNSQLLTGTLQWESLFNEENDLCIYISLGFEQYNPSQTIIVDAFKSVDDRVRTCKAKGDGITGTSLALLLEFILRQLTYIYTDFAKDDPETRNLETFFLNPLFKNIDQVSQNALKQLHNILLFNVLSDMNRMYMRSNMISIFFSISLVVLSLVICFIIHFGLMKKIEKIIDVLKYTEKYFNKAIKTNDNKKDNEIHS